LGPQTGAGGFRVETILGIDLGTTNSAVCVIQDGRPVVLKDAEGQAILPSVVGLDNQGQLLVGQSARNQAVLAPDRTVRSIKRKMGQDITVSMGEATYAPQEISAILLRTLKDQAARALGRPVNKAVITVPAFFSEMQREATRQAGELAGLEVVRIINEPTAASLIYETSSDHRERLLVYDLGGGTFDVSIVQIESGVVEVLSSHGDTQLGGDDFDELLLDHVCQRFREEHGVDLLENPTTRSRLLQAVEEAKKRLSFEAYTSLNEEFVAERDGTPLHLRIELDRHEYERLIEPLLQKTIRCVDQALEEAGLHAKDIDKIVLVGGSSRTPRVHRLLEDQLQQQPHLEIDPDLCVAMGAAVQGALIAGVDVGAVLVDITPHTLGVQCRGSFHGLESNHLFSPIISRTTPLPATRSELYGTSWEGQTVVEINVFQGEEPDVRRNQSVGSFELDGLDESAGEGNEILVRFDLNLDGILTVTAIERATGLEKRLTIQNAITQFRADGHEEALAKLAAVFGDQDVPVQATSGPVAEPPEISDEMREIIKQAIQLIAQSTSLLPSASDEDATEIRELIDQLEDAIARQSRSDMVRIHNQLEDIVFYLQDA
jgi:molecular chaperone DnaK